MLLSISNFNYQKPIHAWIFSEGSILFFITGVQHYADPEDADPQEAPSTDDDHQAAAVDEEETFIRANVGVAVLPDHRGCAKGIKHFNEATARVYAEEIALDYVKVVRGRTFPQTDLDNQRPGLYYTG